MTRQLMPCGTRAAYARHIRHGEQPCDPCLAANRERGADERRAYDLLRRRAIRRIVLLHPDVFEALIEEQRQLDTPDWRGRARARQRALHQMFQLYPDLYEAFLAEEAAS